MTVDILHPFPAERGFGKRMSALMEGLGATRRVRWRRRWAELPAVLVMPRDRDDHQVLFYHSLLAPLLVLLRLLRPGLRLRYMVRGDEILEARLKGRPWRARAARFCQALLARLGVRFIFVSWDLEALFQERYPALTRHCVLPNTLGKPLPPTRAFDGRIGLVGGSVMKNLDWALDELAPTEWEIHVFGRAAGEASPSRRIEHGVVEDLVGELGRHCSLVVVCSLSEGFPNVLVEALEAGCAVLLQDAFPFARFPLAEAWRFPLRDGGLRERLASLSREPRDFARDNRALLDLLGQDWQGLLEQALA